MPSSFDDLTVQADEVSFIEDDDRDPSSLVCLNDLDGPESAPLVPSQNTRGAALIATENDRPWLDTRGAATHTPAPQTTPKIETTPRIVQRRPCEPRHRRSSRGRPIRRRGSRRTTAPTRAGPDDSGDGDPDGDHHPLGRQGQSGEGR